MNYKYKLKQLLEAKLPPSFEKQAIIRKALSYVELSNLDARSEIIDQMMETVTTKNPAVTG